MPIGVYLRTEEHKKKISMALKGRKKCPFSKEHIKNMSKVRRGKHYSPKTEFKKGIIPWIKGKYHSLETRKKISEQAKVRIGSKNPFYGKYHTEETKRINSEAHKGLPGWNKNKKCPQISGEKSGRWKGGITSLYDAIRLSLENKQWKLKVFKRDNYTCQECGDNKGGNLEAHHKKRFAVILKEFLQEYDQFSPIEDKETLLRLAIKYQPFWDINNGKTLCEKCHNKEVRQNV